MKCLTLQRTEAVVERYLYFHLAITRNTEGRRNTDVSRKIPLLEDTPNKEDD